MLDPKLPAHIDYQSLRDGFIALLESKKLDRDYARGMVSYLDRFVKSPIVSQMDIINLFKSLTEGQQRNLIPAMRALLNFAKLMGYDILRKCT